VSLGACTRGCGKRVAGGIYAECPLGVGGRPLEDYLLEPPVVIDPQAMGLTPVGVQLLQRGDTWHVVDWVGEAHYPNVADMVEEIRSFGLSRRLPKTLEFDKLGPHSRILLVHRRAHVDNWAAYLRARASEDEIVGGGGSATWACCKRPGEHRAAALLTKLDHADDVPMCIATWYHDLDAPEGSDSVHVSRVVGDTQYDAMARPVGIQPLYRTAIFATLPIANLCVVANPEDSAQEAAAVVAAQDAKLPVTVEVE